MIAPARPARGGCRDRVQPPELSRPVGSSMTRPVSAPPFIVALNGAWHKRALRIFMVIVLAHLAEHLVQAFQVYALHWPVHEARGEVLPPVPDGVGARGDAMQLRATPRSGDGLNDTGRPGNHPAATSYPSPPTSG